MTDYSLKFKKLRELLNLTQQQFSDNIGISRAVLSQIEIGNQKPTLETIDAIAKKYSIPYDYFFIENGSPVNKQSKEIKTADTVNEQYTGYGYTDLKKIQDRLSCEDNRENKIIMMLEYIMKEIDLLRKEMKKIKSGDSSGKKY